MTYPPLTPVGQEPTPVFDNRVNEDGQPAGFRGYDGGPKDANGFSAEGRAYQADLAAHGDGNDAFAVQGDNGFPSGDATQPSPGVQQGLPRDFYDTLQPASWRGAGFFVRGTRVRAGRRKALHEYPFRDGVWVEDLGRRGRVYGFEGFLVGGDVNAQMAAFLDLVDAQAGPGDLVHPSFGLLRAELIEFEAGDQWDEGRVWRFRIEFVEPVARGLQVQPGTDEDTQQVVEGSALDADAATMQDANDSPAKTDAEASSDPEPYGPPAPKPSKLSPEEQAEIYNSPGYQKDMQRDLKLGQTPWTVDEYKEIHAGGWTA